MPVKRGGLRLIALVAVATLVGFAVAGCAKTAPTSRLVILTPSPMSQTDTPVATDMPLITPSPTAAMSSSPTVALATQPPSATAAPSTVCAGTADNKSFWGLSANAMRWDVYCPVLPSGWNVTVGQYDGSGVGKIHMTLTGPGGAAVSIDEGAFCTTSADACSTHESSISQTAFGDLLGDLDTLAGGGFAVYVNAGTSTGYTLTATGMSQDSFVAIAAAFAKVAKS
jgi:hypothetical protein